MSDLTPKISIPYSYSYHRVGHDGEDVPVVGVSAMWVSVVGIGSVRVFFYDGTFHMNDTPALYRINRNAVERGLGDMTLGPNGGYQKLFGDGSSSEDVVDAASAVKLWLLRNIWSIVEVIE